MYDNEHNNILLHQINVEDRTISFKEIVPIFDPSAIPNHILSLDSSGNICWIKPTSNSEIQEIPEFSIIEDDRIKQTQIYYKDGRVGISRPPLLNYKFDIEVPQNTLMTAFHIGDGKHGFSMGNGTSQGFIPEIIGMGSDENDTGLYLLGKAGNNLSSAIPLIIIDGRNAAHEALSNRPIFGITSGDYLSYKLIVDHQGRLGLGKIPEIYKMEVEGVIEAHDFVVDNLSTKALMNEVRELKKEIDRIGNIVQILQQK
jgi:hypothetical protein